MPNFVLDFEFHRIGAQAKVRRDNNTLWIRNCLALCTLPNHPLSSFVNATMKGSVLALSALGVTIASPPSITAIQELVVPRLIAKVLIFLLVNHFYNLYLQQAISQILCQTSSDSKI
jgi:hypothetical protein